MMFSIFHNKVTVSCEKFFPLIEFPCEIIQNPLQLDDSVETVIMRTDFNLVVQMSGSWTGFMKIYPGLLFYPSRYILGILSHSIYQELCFSFEFET